jgi:hypothetical protein
MSTTDEDAALRAIATLERLSSAQQDALRAVTAIMHDGEPFVDIHELFALYDTLYFRGLLLSRVQVIWSPRLTLVRFFLCFMLHASHFVLHASCFMLQTFRFVFCPSHKAFLKPASCTRTVPHPLLDCRVKQRLTRAIVCRHLRVVQRP